MKVLHYIMICLISFSALLSFQEDHLCSDDGAASYRTEANAGDHDSLTAPRPRGPIEEHELELCHVGHCAHGISFAAPPLTHPQQILVPLLSIPYESLLLRGVSRSPLRPPAHV